MVRGSPKTPGMRKGTHSCTECRRRKIRCDLTPGALVCSNCKSRGKSCASQDGDVARLQLRRRLESNSLPEHSSSDAPAGPDVLENSVTDQRAPFLAVLDPSGVSPSSMSTQSHWFSAPDKPAQLSESPHTDHPSPSSRSPLANGASMTRKSTRLPAPGQGERICETLRAGLPAYDSIMKVATTHNGWWMRIHRALCGTYGGTICSFPDFVRRAYTSNQPAVLGKMAIAFAFASDIDGRNIYSMVDHLIVSGMAHVSTVEGLECLILLAILYADEGQPRRSWMIFRRGVVIAQLTDLYHAGLQSPTKRRLWLSIYRGDRMMSLFLGLPYGFVDMHHEQILQVKPGEDDFLDSKMTIRCAMIAGRVIDWNHSRTKASVAKTLELDEEMNELAASFPESYWELPVRNEHADFDGIHVRLHQQLFFFHLRLYIYLPFLSGSEENFVHRSIIRAASMEAARQLLRCYLALHSDAGALSPSECKLVDFMAFTGAVVLLLGRSSSLPGSRVSESDASDIETVFSLVRCLQRQENQESCPIASQCRKTLSVLLSSSTTDEEVRIPFFGTVVRKGVQTVEQTARAEQRFLPNSNTLGDSRALPPGQPSSSVTVTNLTPASEDPALPSSAYSMAPWDIPELGFLAHLEGESAGFEAGWEFLMDLDSF